MRIYFYTFLEYYKIKYPEQFASWFCLTKCYHNLPKKYNMIILFNLSLKGDENLYFIIILVSFLCKLLTEIYKKCNLLVQFFKNVQFASRTLRKVVIK